MKVLAGNRVYADEIARESTRLGWEIDPNTVESVAFGEGFEQCAMAWKAMVGDYLGWARPIENDFQLSVSGAPCLFDAQFRERLDLDHDIRLFLWEKPNNLWLGFYARCRGRLRGFLQVRGLGGMDPSRSLHRWDVPVPGPGRAGR